MKVMDEKAPLKHLRFSKNMVLLSLFLLAGGAALVMAGGSARMIAGTGIAGCGLAVFFTAGYYWGCDNESCS